MIKQSQFSRIVKQSKNGLIVRKIRRFVFAR